MMPKQTYAVKILWGGAEAREEQEPSVYEFTTVSELHAFLLGIDEAAGWTEYTIIGIKQPQSRVYAKVR